MNEKEDGSCEQEALICIDEHGGACTLVVLPVSPFASPTAAQSESAATSATTTYEPTPGLILGGRVRSGWGRR